MTPVSELEIARTNWKRSGRSVELLVNLNVYGHSHSARAVGDMLAAANMFLQVPLFDGRSAGYDNPQYLKLPNVAHISLEHPATATDQEEISKPKEDPDIEIASLLDHIPQSRFLKEIFTSNRLRTFLIK